MWLCGKCSETIEDDAFETCWNCGTDRTGAPEDGPAPKPQPESLSCVRCSVPLEYVGTKSFHEGANWGVLGELGELFVKRESLDFYFCPRCGHVEFFVDGVGEELRPK